MKGNIHDKENEVIVVDKIYKYKNISLTYE